MSDEAPIKRGPGRPPGSKNKPHWLTDKGEIVESDSPPLDAVCPQPIPLIEPEVELQFQPVSPLHFHPAPLPQSDDPTVLTSEQYLAIAQGPTLIARLESLIELFAARLEDVVDPTWLAAWAGYMRTHKSQIAEMVVRGESKRE